MILKVKEKGSKGPNMPKEKRDFGAVREHLFVRNMLQCAPRRVRDEASGRRREHFAFFARRCSNGDGLMWGGPPNYLVIQILFQ